jgi:hypothetical protein
MRHRDAFPCIVASSTHEGIVMSQLTAHFADQRSAAAAMDQLVGRGLGHARVQPLVERPAGQDGHDDSPSALGQAKLEVYLGDGASESEVRDLLQSLGATSVAGGGIHEPASHALPSASAPSGAAGGHPDDDVARAVAASERGATGAGGPPHDARTERSIDDKRTRHDPRR